MALFIAQAIGIDLGFRIVSGVSSSARNISDLMGFIKKKDKKSDLMSMLENSDVEHNVRVLECVVLELNVTQNTPVSIINCLKSLYRILIKIEDELKVAKERIEYNSSLNYFTRIRSYGFSNTIKRMNKNLEILRIRRTLLYDTLKIKNALSKGNVNNKSLLAGTLLSPGKSQMNKNKQYLSLENNKEIHEENNGESNDENKRKNVISDSSILDDEFKTIVDSNIDKID
jgi:hypothetical protein